MTFSCFFFFGGGGDPGSFFLRLQVLSACNCLDSCCVLQNSQLEVLRIGMIGKIRLE